MSNEQQQQLEVDPIYTLAEEIQKEAARLKRIFQKCSGEQAMAAITGSVLPLLAQLADTVRSHDSAIEDVLAHIDGEEGTQFTIEDAQRFELVLTYARETAKAQLENPSLDPSSEAHKKLTEIFATAEGCLKTLEESTLTGEAEEGGETEGPN